MNKKKRILTIVVLLVAIFAVVLIALDCVFVYLFSKTWQEVLTTSTNYIIAGLVVAGVGVWLAMDYRVRVGNRVLKVNVELENSRWLTKKDIHQNDGFTTVNFEKLNTVVDGIPVAAEVKKDELTVVLRKPIHTLVIGSTGTGKTSSFVSPSIEIISRTKTQPDMVITDPKGELYRKHAESLKNNGYNVHIIDLNSPFTSTRYNLLDGVINKTSRLKNLKIEVVRGKYVIDNKTFKTMEEAERQKALSERELDTQIFIELQDFIYAMYPSTR
ncbi:MAG: type IV secretory system conjugative DNA transfer family protein, partial [Clostridia bacterium]|nr:type IV secretory system conjugative DNA transfer family protein [Clostridia bacterium]